MIHTTMEALGEIGRVSSDRLSAQTGPRSPRIAARRLILVAPFSYAMLRDSRDSKSAPRSVVMVGTAEPGNRRVHKGESNFFGGGNFQRSDFRPASESVNHR